MRFEPDPNFECELARMVLPEAADRVAGIAEGYDRQIGGWWMPRNRREAIQVQGRGEDVYVTNTRFGAHLQEWGSQNNAAHAPLRRAVRTAGFQLKED